MMHNNSAFITLLVTEKISKKIKFLFYFSKLCKNLSAIAVQTRRFSTSVLTIYYRLSNLLVMFYK